MKLNDIRQKIDQVDLKLIELLDQRFDLVDEVKNYKQSSNVAIEDTTRETEILKVVSKHSKHKEDVLRLYKALFTISKERQSKG